VALFRATDTVLDCGEGVIIDFPSWKAMREMLQTNKPEIVLTVQMIRRLAGDAEEELAAGLAEAVAVDASDTPLEPSSKRRKDDQAFDMAVKRQKKEMDVDAHAWFDTDLDSFPNNIRLVKSTECEAYAQLIEEASQATVVAYDAQWSPDFDEKTDNQIALLQLAFPTSGNAYVLQLPNLGLGWPPEVQQLFESSSVSVTGFAADEKDTHKFEISGINIDKDTLFNSQPWCEAEMGENESVKQGWRVGLKRAALCVLDFEMDKTSVVASSNWEREELTTAQIEYAAMDVWVALRLYQRLACAYKP